MPRPIPERRIQAVIFDWDGTLLDSYSADCQAYRGMFRDLGVTWGKEDFVRHYSPDWYRVYQAAGIPRARWEEADLTWRRHYSELRPTLLPGARQVLRALFPRCRLALVTSGNRSRVKRQLRRFHLMRAFAACVCCEDAPRRKPDPAPLEMAIRRLGVQRTRCVYVGDAPEDVEMARRAGVRAIAVLGPFPTHERLRAARPYALLRSIANLPSFVR